MFSSVSVWPALPLSLWADARLSEAVTWNPQAWTLGSTGASSVLLFYLLFKFSPYVSSASVRSYSTFTTKDRLDWDSRVSSTLHAVAISALAAYLLLWTDSFSDKPSRPELWRDPPLKRHTELSSAALGLSVGYFFLDICLILRHFPLMGGPEMLAHHSASFLAVALASFTGQAHLYTLLLLSTELTTPFVNGRWFIDQLGWRTSRIYIANGVCLFVSWLFARIALFLWFFKHMWEHQTEITELRADVQLLILTVPALLFILNVFWFGKIAKGLIKVLRGGVTQKEDMTPRIIKFRDSRSQISQRPMGNHAITNKAL